MIRSTDLGHAMTPDEALNLLNDCRERGDRTPYDGLFRMKRLVANASVDDHSIFNAVIRSWFSSADARDRYDAAWITGQLELAENLDIVLKLRDEAESRTDTAALDDWAKYNRIAGLLTEQES